MTDLRKRNNMASKICYEKKIEKEHADAYEYEIVRQHSLLPDTIAWHWSCVPEECLYEAGYITDFNKVRLERLMNNEKNNEKKGNRLKDYGLDGVAKTGDVYYGLQAKLYRDKSVCASDIGSFLAVQMSLTLYNPLSKGYLYTTSKLQLDLQGLVLNPSYPIRHVLHKWEYPDGRTQRTYTKRECDYPLRDYQEDSIKQLDKDGINVLIKPCGMGKTITSGHVIKRKNPTLIIAMAPLKISVENLQERLTCFLPNHKQLLVDSEGTTDIIEITTFLSTEGLKIIYTTFKSAIDVLSKIEFKCDYILGDEIHNANEELCEFINRFSNGLIMSAAIPEEIVNLIDINHTVHIPFSQGIRDGYIVDYTLWLPHLNANGVDVDIPVEFSDDLTDDLTAKAFYNACCMLKTGSRRCIVYLGSQEDCDRYGTIIKRVFEEYHGCLTWIGKIDSTVKNRKEILAEFQNGPNDVFYILTSVRILDEAVDIPKCDSVFVTIIGEQSSDIRMLQRCQRSSRKDPENPSKHNNIFLWADGWEKCINSLELLKSVDPEFHKKIRICDSNYDKSSDKERIELVKVEREEFVKWVDVKCLTLFEKHLLMIDKLKEFYEEYGEAPKTYGLRTNENLLINWIVGRRRDKKNNRLIIELENKIMIECPWFSWDVFKDNYTKAIHNLKEFYEKYKEPPITNGLRNNEKKLAQWISCRRRDKKNNRLSIELEVSINNLFSWWSWDKKKDSHTKYIIKLQQFYNEYKEEPIADGSRLNEKQLVSWIGNRRTSAKLGKVSDDLKEQIKTSCPWFSWNTIIDGHVRKIKELKEFYEKYNELPKQKGTRENEKILAEWISSCCKNKKNGKLDTELETKIMTECPWFKWIRRPGTYGRTK